MTIDEAEKIKTVVENKDYLAQLLNTVAKTMLEAFENFKIEDVNMYQLGYNKAIDDCIKEVEEEEKQHNHIITKDCLFWLKRKFKQLKGDASNGTDNQQ